MGTAAHRDKDGVVQIDAQEPIAQLYQLAAGRVWSWCSHWAEKRTGLWAKSCEGGTNRRHSCLLHQCNFNF